MAAAAAGLGVIGMDPAGALLAAAALAVGSRTRDVVVFGLVGLLGTAVVGLVLSLTVGEQLLELDWAALLPRGGFRAALEAGGAVGLLGWWAIRRRPGRRAGGRPRPRRVRVGLAGSFAAGVLFIATAFTDPTFVAAVILSAGGGTVLEGGLGNAVWSVVSQLPLLGLMVALARGRDRVLAAVHRLRTRWGPRSRVLVSGAVAAAALALLVDVASWLVTESFLVGS